jgi:hypothetical protein
MGGMRPLGPPKSPRLGREHTGRWKIDRNHPLDWEKTSFLLDPAGAIIEHKEGKIPGNRRDEDGGKGV